MNRPLLCLSDDLTGALACAAELERAGLSAAVMPWDQPRAEAEAMVVDTASRELDPIEASRRTSDALGRALRALGREPRLIYQRVDSGLRGNIRAELGALSASRGGQAGVVAVAAPALGTITRGGIQLHRGESLTASPYGSGSEATRAAGPGSLVPGSAVPLSLDIVRAPGLEDVLAAAVARGQWPVCDGETAEDLAAVAVAAQSAKVGLLAGSYGLAGAVARVDLAAEGRAPAGVLVVTATRRGPTQEQVRALERAGGLAIAPSEFETGVAALREGRVVVMSPRSGHHAGPRDVVEAAVAILGLTRPAGIVIIGGGLASALARACGAGLARIISEPWPATPVARFEAGDIAGVPVILKSGALGDAGWLVDAVALLQAPTHPTRTPDPCREAGV